MVVLSCGRSALRRNKMLGEVFQHEGWCPTLALAL
jgi:hypothetical protein